MKRTLTIVACLALVASLFAFSPIAGVKADTPTLDITSPIAAGGTIFVPSFPYNTSISFNITHSQLKDLNVLSVLVNGTSIVGDDIGNPFNNSNACSNPNLTSVSTNCSTNGSDQASVTVPWTVNEPGNYTITVAVRHQGNEGEDEELVAVALMAVEFPAPPAVANAYIKATYAKLTAGRRGCVISNIANAHGQNERYGPKGGPYDEALIRSDVNLLLATTCQ
jgi:hypothetical protein